ncbi:MAG: hypothetical protein WB538_18000 [Candidatus Sulfotelmatobacter sp.]
MANEEKLLGLLRRAYTLIGEALIENALDKSAEGLHNEIAEALGLPVAKRDTVRCGAKWFVAGGRVERQCRENAGQVCAICGNARCDEHDDLGFEEHDGHVMCEECLPEKGREQ